MSASNAAALFTRLIEQVRKIESIAATFDKDVESAQILRRSAYVLAVAAIDSYFQEYALERLVEALDSGDPDTLSRIRTYLGGVSEDELSGEHRASYVAYRLGYKTLVSSTQIDAAIAAWGGNPDAVWREHAIKSSSRDERVKRELDIVYDRRNQIAHQGDWDRSDYSFRAMEQQHLESCLRILSSIAMGFEDLNYHSSTTCEAK